MAALGVAALLLASCGSDGDVADDSPPVADVADSVLVEPEADSTDDVPAEPVEEPTDADDTADEPVEELIDDEEEPAESDASGDAEPQDAIQQNGPISISGDPLPILESAEDPAIGTPAPVVTGQSFDGTEVVVGGPSDNATMVVFLAHWCPACNAEVPELVALNAAGSVPDGLDVVAVSTAVTSDRDNFPPSEWIVEKGWPWPTMADDERGSALEAFGASSFPFTVILDADGTVLARREGVATAEATVAFIDAALG